jgi:hypothetical protein
MPCVTSRFLTILVFVAAFTGCDRHVTVRSQFYGVTDTAPSSGHDKVIVTQNAWTWRGDSFIVTLEPQDDVIQMRRNGTVIGSARSGQAVQFARDGHVESQK